MIQLSAKTASIFRVPISASILILAGCLLGLLLDPVDGGSTSFRYFIEFLPDYTALNSRR
jgi:hypothetical protein